VEAAWEGDALPTHVTVRTARFTVDTTLDGAGYR
jgi:hypothetical protein